MTDPGGAILVTVLVLVPPAAVLLVTWTKMGALQETFAYELQKLRLDLQPFFQPEKMLLPKMEQIETTLTDLCERMERTERMLDGRKLEKP